MLSADAPYSFSPSRGAVAARVLAIAILFAPAFSACSDSSEDGDADTGTADAVEDTGPADTGDDLDTARDPAVDGDRDVANTPDANGPDDVSDAAEVRDVDPGDTRDPDAVIDRGSVSRPPSAYSFEPQALTGLIDPMIGTQGGGNVIPGALVPHGMLRASPVTNDSNAIDVYEYGQGQFFGVTHTHLEGPGGSGNGYSQIVMLPRVGPVATDPSVYVASFSHDNETARPGHYRVVLDDGIQIDLTATGHAAVHRYAFPDEGDPHLLIDLGESRGISKGGAVTIDPGERTVEGFALYDMHPAVSAITMDGTTARSRIYFSIALDTPFESAATWKDREGGEPVADRLTHTGSGLGAVLYFADGTETVEARIGVSMISEEHARQNRTAQLADRAFDEIVDEAVAAWNARLNRIQVTGDAELRGVFYTALYHFFFQPAVYTETDGLFFTWADGVGARFRSDGWRYYTDDWCLWDTFRTSHPLRTLIAPDVAVDEMHSFLHIYRQGGWLPKCPWNAAGYSRVMTANPAVPMLADTVVKGLADFDTAVALEATLKSSNEDENPLPLSLCGYFNMGTPPEYVESGFVSHQCDATQGASMTLEHAYDDWALSQMAAFLEESEIAEQYAQRGQNFRHHWDPELRFMRGLNRDGTFVEPFDPADFSDVNDFVEATAWTFSFFAPHDVDGLIELYGGDEAFISRLDEYFDSGYYDPSNQPSFHIPYLYNFAGAPHRTQQRTRELALTHFQPGPGGLPGNDDAGSMSAWFVLTAVGLYPIAPGSVRYEITTPLFERVELFFDSAFYDGGSFVIVAEGLSDEATYIQSATLDGEPHDRAWIGHDELVAGGELRLVMGEDASSWGSER